jgi:C4-dicarboxylate-specific signal transduction histidine kinase
VSIDIIAPGEKLLVVGHRILLQQLLVNLFNNASQTMGHAEMAGRQLRIAIGIEGADALVSVCDNRPDFTPEAAERGFDPFFTTRGRGR